MAYEHILVDAEDGVGDSSRSTGRAAQRHEPQARGRAARRGEVLEADDAIGCLVITGAGERLLGRRRHQGATGGRQSLHAAEEQDRMGDPRRTYEISACAKPTIGMMNGLAYGGAAVLASALDIRVGCEARVSLPRCGLREDQRNWTLPQPDRLAAGQGAAVHRARRRGRRGLSHRLLNHLVPRAQLRAKTMQIANTIAGNHRGAVMGVKALLLEAAGGEPVERWSAEHRYTTEVMRNAPGQGRIPRVPGPQGQSSHLIVTVRSPRTGRDDGAWVIAASNRVLTAMR